MAAHNSRRWLFLSVLDLPPLPTLSFTPLLTTPLPPPARRSYFSQRVKLAIVSLVVLAIVSIVTVIFAASWSAADAAASSYPISHTDGEGNRRPSDIIYTRLNYTRLASMAPHEWINTVTELNEARNLMIEHGREHGARWVLPMDGNHFLTREAWAFIAAAANRHEARGKTVFKIPRVKLDKPQTPDIINGSTLFSDLFPHAPSMHEGILAFRNVSPHRFQPVHPCYAFYTRLSTLWSLRAAMPWRSKLEAFSRICGTGNPYTVQQIAHHVGLTRLLYPDATPQPADTGECGCQSETGSEEAIRPMRMAVLRACGVVVRLWYYPCAHVDTRRMIYDGRYRFQQRQKALLLLRSRIEEQIKQAMAEQSS
ncbi:unnamed protein product [Closterium sp. Naga37s-1]|nr:unnamed protein product [Closterium sp. Naga37s-1]